MPAVDRSALPSLIGSLVAPGQLISEDRRDAGQGVEAGAAGSGKLRRLGSVGLSVSHRHLDVFNGGIVSAIASGPFRMLMNDSEFGHEKSGSIY